MRRRHPGAHRTGRGRRLAALGSALLALVLLAGCGERGPAQPNVVLVTLDTTRADRLGAYGYERATSPHFDELARHATLYENAYAPSSWTLPSHATLFTGKLPSSHGVRYDPEGGLVLAESLPRAPADIRARGLPRSEATLPKRLRRAGYATGAFVGGPWLLERFGFSPGFETYDDRGIEHQGGRRADDVTAAATDWLRGTEPPFFLFVNYFDPHRPYAPPASHRRTFLPPGVRPDGREREQWPDLYDAEILFMDQYLGNLLRTLRERGVYEETLVVVTADHGELLGEHGEFGHSRWLWEELVRVPLVVKPARPEPEGRRVITRVGLVDLFPRILERVGLAVPDGIRGRAEPDPERVYLAETEPVTPRDPTGSWKAIWEGPFKYLRSSQGDRLLFDLRRDRDESESLAPSRPERLARVSRTLRTVLEGLPEPSGEGPTGTVDARTRETLRALGYLERGSGADSADEGEGERKEAR